MVGWLLAGGAVPGELGLQGAGGWGIEVGWGGHRTPEGVGVGGGGGSSVGEGCGLGGAGRAGAVCSPPSQEPTTEAAPCVNRWEAAETPPVSAGRARRGTTPHTQPPVQEGLGEGCGEALQSRGAPHSHAPPSTAPQDRAALGCKAYTTRQVSRPSLAAQPPKWPWVGVESSLLGSLSFLATVAHVLTTPPLPQRAPTADVAPSCLVLSSCSRWGANKTDGQRSVRLRLCGAPDPGHSRT